METGDVLFFDGHLFHKSGSNSTEDEIRFSLVGMWNNINESSFRGPKPNFLQRTSLTAKEYWQKNNVEQKWGY
jgi:ectoine hydroxylase-related dioxygenase (phytanoyl-CoA dioxygenase family)